MHRPRRALKTVWSFQSPAPTARRSRPTCRKGIGGGGGVPRPGWLTRAALASCTGSVIAMRAAKLGIALEKLEVEAESQSDNRGMLGLDDRVSAGLIGLRAVVRIRAANATRNQLEALVRWGDAHSPVACTLRHALGTEIEVIVE